MSRYIVQPRGALVYESWQGTSITADTVVEPEDRRAYTGLVNAEGHPIYRLPEPIGFDPKRWR